MPFDRSNPLRKTSGPWGSDLVFLNDGGSTFGEDDGAFSEGSADRAGVDEGVYKFDEGGKLRPVMVDGVYHHSSTLGISDYDKPEPGYMETVAAAFRTDNMIASGFVSRAMAIPDEAYLQGRNRLRRF